MIRQMDPPCPYFIVEIEPVVARSIYLPDRYRRREEDYLHVHVPTLFSLPSPPSLLLLMNPNLYPQSLSLSLSLITPSFPSPFSLIYCSLLSAFCIPIPNPVLSISRSVSSFHSPHSPHSPHSLSAVSVLSVVEYDKIETRTRIRMRIATRKRMILGYWKKLFFPLVLIVFLHLLLLVVVI